MDLELGGHVALVTGAGSGIGLATAKAFAVEGCKLVLWDVKPEIGRVAEELAEEFGIEALGQIMDVADYDCTQEAFRKVVEMEWDVQHVVHSAAVGSQRFGFPFTNLTPSDWKRVLDINMGGMVNVAHTVAPFLIERQRGSFVFLASVAGQIGSQTDPPYSASKAANINFAQCMAKDLAAHGIRVNTVCPGMVETALNRSVWQAWHEQAPIDERIEYEGWAAKKIQSLVPLGRWQTPDDIASMIVFLSSERAKQVTGQTINVDGGFVMHS